jgi:hypothetical protein
MHDQLLNARVFGTVALNAAALPLNGETFTPDGTKAYAAFRLAHSFPTVDAYGCCRHPGVVAASHASLRHQPVNYNHQMKKYGTDKNPIRDDNTLGTVVAVNYPPAPVGGWKLSKATENLPAIQGVMVIHKNVAKAQNVMGEHLTGKHKWTVSMEMAYNFLDSGFLVSDLGSATKAQTALLEEWTPAEVKDLGLGYIAVENAPKELLDCFDSKTRRITGAWNKCPVSLMQGGLAGTVHFAGVGIVRYGAEREAQILEMLAQDPDRVGELTAEELGLEYFTKFAAGLEKIVADILATDGHR